MENGSVIWYVEMSLRTTRTKLYAVVCILNIMKFSAAPNSPLVHTDIRIGVNII